MEGNGHSHAQGAHQRRRPLGAQEAIMVDMLTGADVSNRSVRDHSEYLMLISLGLDGMLDADEKRRLDVHLERCSSCRAQRMLWQAIDSRLREAPVPVLAPGFSHSVAQRLARQERRRNLQIGVMLTVFILLVWSLGLTGVCALTGAVVYTNMDRFAETGLFLSEALAVAGEAVPLLREAMESGVKINFY